MAPRARVDRADADLRGTAKRGAHVGEKRGLVDERVLKRPGGDAALDTSHFLSGRRIAGAAKHSERLSLARELHDGILQTLTGIVLELEGVLACMDDHTHPVNDRLRDFQAWILAEQQELRRWVEYTVYTRRPSVVSHVELSASLHIICCRVARWGPCVQLTPPESGILSRRLANHVYRLVGEAVSNAAKHAAARSVRVEVNMLPDRVLIVVEDNGHGFTFRGQFDLEALNAGKMGPVSLKERVASLRGKLLVTSNASGSTVEIELPIPRQPRRRWKETPVEQQAEAAATLPGHRVAAREGAT